MTWPSTFATGTLGYLKDRIADELARGDLTTQIAAAISDSILFYQNHRFSFNSGGSVLVAAPAADSTVGNAWMTTAEALIRARSKRLLALNVLRDDALASALMTEETACLQQLSYRVVAAATTPGTLGAMKARIADEVSRADLTTQIAQCIADAIIVYQSQRFYFSESRTVCTFNTVIGQEFYSSADNAAIGTMFLFDYLTITIGVTPFELGRREPVDLELASNNATIRGQPTDYAYYDSKLRLYPVPSSVYPIRVAGHMNIAAPAADGTTGNKWMTDAERLIRSRAKYELSLNYGVDFPNLATRMNGAAADALTDLKGTTNKLTGTGRMRPTQF